MSLLLFAFCFFVMCCFFLVDPPTLPWSDKFYFLNCEFSPLQRTLRLYPAVSYGTQRELDKDEFITVPDPDSHDGRGEKQVLLPKGTNVMCHNFSNHRNKQLWGEDANEWKPERWDGYGDRDAVNFAKPSEDGEEGDEESWRTVYSARNPQSARFHPFTRSPRQCFGMNFAQAEMRVVIPLLISKFEFSLAEPTATKVARNGMDSEAYQLAGILKPRDGLFIHCKPRMKAKM